MVTMYTPTEEYSQSDVLGFAIRIHPDVVQRETMLKELIDVIHEQLELVIDKVPPLIISRLQSPTKIWVEQNPCQAATAADVHWDDDWLIKNGHNPDKANGIELGQLEERIARWRREVFCELMHELAHVHHSVHLKAENQRIENTYNQAMNALIYDSVRHVSGQKRCAYACENYKEYFASLSVAYFMRNDYFPFDRAQLACHDPAGYSLIEDCWSP